jgi:hypothetical protein
VANRKCEIQREWLKKMGGQGGREGLHKNRESQRKRDVHILPEIERERESESGGEEREGEGGREGGREGGGGRRESE